MSARIAPGLIARIRELRSEGMRYGEIAGNLGVAYNTVRKYGREADVDVVIGEAAAAELDERQVAKLLWVTSLVDDEPCPNVSCGAPAFSWRWAKKGVCPSCGTGWTA